MRLGESCFSSQYPHHSSIESCSLQFLSEEHTCDVCSGVKIRGNSGHRGWPHGECDHTIATADIQVPGAHPKDAHEEVPEGALSQHKSQYSPRWDTVFRSGGRLATRHSQFQHSQLQLCPKHSRVCFSTKHAGLRDCQKHVRICVCSEYPRLWTIKIRYVNHNLPEWLIMLFFYLTFHVSILKIGS